MESRLIIISAPSGSGKSTILNFLLKKFPCLEFSISATSRAPRGEEKNGVEYHFLTSEEFKRAAQNNEFVEWEEVYAGTCYGTLKSELERIWAKGNVIVFDIDVKGAINLKKIFGTSALSMFIMPPSVEILRERLTSRGTDSVEAIEKRVSKAAEEIEYAKEFDSTVVNDDLMNAVAEAEKLISDFLK
ncbi:MAG: guanylate kinase [Rikenellaceae bacterium]